MLIFYWKTIKLPLLTFNSMHRYGISIHKIQFPVFRKVRYSRYETAVHAAPDLTGYDALPKKRVYLQFLMLFLSTDCVDLILLIPRRLNVRQVIVSY